MTMKKNYLLYMLLAGTLGVVSCKKSAYLDANPDQSLIIPETLKDYQAILDNSYYLNGDLSGAGVIPILGEIGADNYYLSNDGFSILSSMSPAYQNMYAWSDDIYNNGVKQNGWGFSYKAVFYSNTVLDGLSKLKNLNATDQQIFNNLKGSALFFRSEMFYELAQVYAPAYDSATADKDLGIVLKLSADVNEKITRATVQQTYDQAIGDLQTAVSLLPVISTYKTRPSKPAAYALLSRIFLSVHDYKNAFAYADSSLQLYSSLMDYNTLNPSQLPPIPRLNEEIIHQSLLDNSDPSYTILYALVDSTLYNSYDSNDLRKTVFFTDAAFVLGYPGIFFQGSYNGDFSFWGGIATDEVYLIRAEANARLGRVSDAMTDLNRLLITRWKQDSFVAFTATDAQNALQQVLTERRKELLFRGLRWSDLRRLNQEGANITVTHNLNGQTYTLAPNSTHYTYLIPPDVISSNPGMSQNPR
jgi:tetratricopeptide (TPR) repeat protein